MHLRAYFFSTVEVMYWVSPACPFSQTWYLLCCQHFCDYRVKSPAAASHSVAGEDIATKSTGGKL